jgi:hypothetical protein
MYTRSGDTFAPPYAHMSLSLSLSLYLSLLLYARLCVAARAPTCRKITIELLVLSVCAVLMQMT